MKACEGAVASGRDLSGREVEREISRKTQRERDELHRLAMRGKACDRYHADAVSHTPKKRERQAKRERSSLVSSTSFSLSSERERSLR